MKQARIPILILLLLSIVIMFGVIASKQNSFHCNKKSLSVFALTESKHHQQFKKPAIAPDLALKPQARRSIPLEPSPLNEPSTEELREFPGAVVVEAREIEGPEPGQKTRLRILNTHFKYPHIRTEEIIDAQNNTLVMRQEMVADHFLVTLAPDETPEIFF